MDAELSAFLRRAEAVLARVEPLLPEPCPAIDWSKTLAARWQRNGASGFLAPLKVSLDLSLDDLIGVDRQRDLLEANTRQFIAGMPAIRIGAPGARAPGYGPVAC